MPSVGDGTGFDGKGIPTAQGATANEQAKPQKDAGSPTSLGGEGPVKESGGNRTSPL